MQSTATFELISWLITLLLVTLVMAPIYLNVQGDYLFYFENIAFIVIFCTFLRVLFLTPYHWFDHLVSVKVILIFIVIPIILFIIDNQMDFQRFIDDYGVNSMLVKMDADDQTSLGKYIKAEYIFFMMAALICSAVLPVKMIRSIRRMKIQHR